MPVPDGTYTLYVAAKIAEQENYPVSVGAEYLACEGDIVAFGIDRLPEPPPYGEEFIDYVTARGGICISAHPYRANSRGLGDMLFTLKGMTGVEVLNGSTTPLENRKALEYLHKDRPQAVRRQRCPQHGAGRHLRH